MHIKRYIILGLLVITLPLIGMTQPVVEGFTEDVIETNLKTGIGIEFDKNGRGYIWDMEGKVLVLDSNLTLHTTPFLDITEEVAKWLDIGMVGFTLHPDFPTVPYIYTLYAVDLHYEQFFGTENYDAAKTIKNSATFGRIARFTADIKSDYLSIIPESKLILLGHNEVDGFPILFDSHGVGSLVFGNDGSLLASLGDSASSFGEDIGSNWATYWEIALSSGIIKDKDNVGAFRSQMLSNLSGKLIRIDAETGLGLPSNPFYVDGQADSAKSKIWSLGVRNGYRFTVKPETGSHFQQDGLPGTIYLGDVGYSDWEEINVIDRPGLNLGWPLFEGGSISKYDSLDVRNLEFANHAECEEYYQFSNLLRKDNLEKSSIITNPCNDEIISDAPTYYHHRPKFVYRNSIKDSSAVSFIPTFNDQGEPEWINTAIVGVEPIEGVASVGGLFYNSRSFPQIYHGKYFHLDYSGWIKVFSFDQNDNLSKIEDFYKAGKNMTCIALHPRSGDIFAVSKNGRLHRISYTENAKPIIDISHSPLYGSSPLSITIDASKTTDADQPLRYEWIKDGSEVGNEEILSFVLEGNDKTVETIHLRVTDNLGAFSEEYIDIYLNNSPPKVSILSPINKSHFPNDFSHSFNFEGKVTDEDDDDDLLTYNWEIYLHHNEHTHYDQGFSGKSPNWHIRPLGCLADVYWYRVKLIGIDPDGLSAFDEVEIYPNCNLDNYPTISLQTWATSQHIDINSQFQRVWSNSAIELQRSYGESAFEVIEKVDIDKFAESLTFKDFVNEKGQYKYRIKLVDENESWFYSNVSAVSFPSEKRISIFPNPTSSQLSIRIEKVLSDKLTFVLYNAKGNKVMEEKFEVEKDKLFDRKVDLFWLSNGVYFYEINTGLNYYSGKVNVINK